MRCGFVALLLLFHAGTALAAPCEQDRIPHELEIPEMATPQDPPGAIELAEATVRRGRDGGGDDFNGGCATEAVEEIGNGITTDCPEEQNQAGWVELRFKPPVDDRTPPHKLGYRVVLVEGTLPEGLYLPSNPVRSFKRSTSSYAVHLVWEDGETNTQEPVDFAVDLIPVDLAGLEGPAYRLEVLDLGSDGGGCTVAPASRSLLPLLVGLFCLFVLRLSGRPATRPQ